MAILNSGNLITDTNYIGSREYISAITLNTVEDGAFLLSQFFTKYTPRSKGAWETKTVKVRFTWKVN